MKGKKFLFLGGGGLLLLMGWALHHQWRVGSAPLPLSFELEQVEKIQLGKGSPASDSDLPHLVTFVKAKRSDDSDWRIPDLSNAQADEKKIERLLKEMHRSKQKLVGQDPSLFSNFGLGNGEAFQVNLFDGNWTPLLSLLVGVKKEKAQTFIRQPGSNQIYRVDGDLLEAIGIEGDPVREKPNLDFWIKAQEEPTSSTFKN